jgi:hypothetical protein
MKNDYGGLKSCGIADDPGGLLGNSVAPTVDKCYLVVLPIPVVFGLGSLTYRISVGNGLGNNEDSAIGLTFVVQ